MILTKTQVGWAQAFFSVLVLWGVSNVFMTFNTQVLEVNKIVFACATYTSCSLCLLLYAGQGTLSKETLRSVDTWAYGIIMLLNYFITLNLFGTITASEASLLQRFSVIVSLLLSWIFLMRKPSKGQIIGALIISAGLLVVSRSLPNEIAVKVYVLMFLAAIFQSLRIFVAELHRPHKKAAESNDVKARCRVVGYVMFVIMILFLALVTVFSLIQFSVPAENRFGLFVDLNDFMHAPSVFMGMIMGVFIYAPIRYLEFSSSHIIKAENFLAVTALSFFSTIIWEWATLPITGLSLKELSTTDILAGVVVTIGALIMSISKMREGSSASIVNNYLEANPQNLDGISDSREILANSLEYFQWDEAKVAESIEVPQLVVKALLNDKEKIMAFKPEILKTVARNYRRKVAMSDALTGLANRAGFMTAIKGAAYEAEVYSLLFIDLNKFKPVNDTHGHDAGDAILKGVAERLTALFPKRALTTRLGGDEFAILLLDNTKEQALKHVASIKESLAQPFNFKGTEIVIGGSVGIASYPEDGTDPEALLKLADEGMYEEKKVR